MNRCLWQLLLISGISCGFASLVYGQCGMPAGARTRQTGASRLAQLVEANVVATHAYQVLLARKSGKGDKACYVPGKLADGGFDLVNGAHIWRINRSVLWASAEAPGPAAGAGNLRAADVGKPGKGGGFHTAGDFVEDWAPG